MHGIVFPGDRSVELREFCDPLPDSGEVVLEIKASGMCGSDLHIYRSKGGGQSFGSEQADIICLWAEGLTPVKELERWCRWMERLLD